MGSYHDHHHDHDHNHSHGRSHGHAHATDNIALAFFLNSAFAIIELIGGLMTNSVAVLSDALHDFGDSLSLGTAWYFQKKSEGERSINYTYGYKRFSLIGAFINAVVLMIGSVFIISEAVQRLFNPEPANAEGMLYLALLGIVVNAVAMMRLRKGGSINEKVVSLHFLEDVLGWVAVLIGSIVMMFVDLPVIDPILSLAIACFVLFNVYRNIKPAFTIILQGVPENVTEEKVRALVLQEAEITGIHDFRVWTLDGIHHVMSLHVVVRNNLDLKQAEALKEKVKSRLHEINISHATIEVEFDPQHCGDV
jgi:cobalt-zinc-cadmium efflux system protein